MLSRPNSMRSWTETPTAVAMAADDEKHDLHTEGDEALETIPEGSGLTVAGDPPCSIAPSGERIV